MNNEQNNTFGIPNQVQPNNQTISGSTAIPGANLTPIGPNDNTSVMPTNQTPINMNNNINNVGVQPVVGQGIEQPPVTNLTSNAIPGIVTGASTINTPNIPNTPINILPNENLISVDNNNVVPGTDNQMPVSNTNTNVNDLNSGLNSTQQLNTGTPVIEQSVLTPNIPINQAGVTNENMQPINNNLGDATPLTNEGINEGGEIVSVWKYLGIVLLFCVPVVGQIMLFVKAFGNEKNKNIKNLARAYLLLAVIAIVLSIVFSIVFAATLLATFTHA